MNCFNAFTLETSLDFYVIGISGVVLLLYCLDWLRFDSVWEDAWYLVYFESEFSWSGPGLPTADGTLLSGESNGFVDVGRISRGDKWRRGLLKTNNSPFNFKIIPYSLVVSLSSMCVSSSSTSFMRGFIQKAFHFVDAKDDKNGDWLLILKTLQLWGCLSS